MNYVTGMLVNRSSISKLISLSLLFNLNLEIILIKSLLLVMQVLMRLLRSLMILKMYFVRLEVIVFFEHVMSLISLDHFPCEF